LDAPSASSTPTVSTAAYSVKDTLIDMVVDVASPLGAVVSLARSAEGLWGDGNTGRNAIDYGSKVVQRAADDAKPGVDAAGKVVRSALGKVALGVGVVLGVLVVGYVAIKVATR
jgi:hypothetical protein